MNSCKPCKRPISIRWKLVFFLGFLTAIVLLITWIFQVYLLDRFYEYTKRREIEFAASTISDHLDCEDLRSVVGNIAADASMRIMIFRINEQGTETVVDIDATGGMALYPNQSHANALLKRVRNHGGMHIYKVTFGGHEVSDNGPFDLFAASENESSTTDINPENTRLICVNESKDQAGNACLIVLNTALLPLDSTVQTLHIQFIWIAAALFLVSVLAVFFIYRSISKPLIRMNEAAKQLAKGKYDTNFVGSGYLETHELADTLNYASNELSRVDRLQKELIANISHDLRTPLTMIKGYSELMRDIPGEMSPDNMQIVIDETERLSELVNDLLDLSQLQSGNQQFSCTEFNLTETVREVMKRYETFVHHRGYSLTFSADGDVWVCADRKQIMQALYNLINNAINYTGDDCLVFVEQAVSNDTVRISIRDTGEGIDADQIPLIWDRYYKVDKVHRRAMVGTGIGLSIVKGILQKHQAVYGVNSQPGAGSTFWFEFPTVSPSSGELLISNSHTEE